MGLDFVLETETLDVLDDVLTIPAIERIGHLKLVVGKADNLVIGEITTECHRIDAASPVEIVVATATVKGVVAIPSA